MKLYLCTIMLLVSVCDARRKKRVRAGPTCMRCVDAVGDETDCNTQAGIGSNTNRCRFGKACSAKVSCGSGGELIWTKGCRDKDSGVIGVPQCNDDHTECRLLCAGGRCNRDVSAILLPYLYCSATSTMTVSTTEGEVCKCDNLMPAITPMAQSNSEGPSIPDCTARMPEVVNPQNAIWPALYSKRWSGATIPYDLVNYDATQTTKIMAGINMLNSLTCLNLIQRTTETNYVEVFNGNGCWSWIGMNGDGKQQLSLFDSTSSTCLGIGTIMHEFLHAAGFFHEHTRPDRDDFVCVNVTNIIEDKRSNFDTEENADTLETPYTIGSVMHYGGNFFDIDDGYLTLYPKSCDEEDLAEFGQRDGLHAVDIERVAKLYAGLGACPAVP